jgi:hypothetical protein
MSTAHKTIYAIVIFAVGLVSSSVGGATVRSGRAVFPEPHNPPSIGVPPPPADQAHQYDREVVIQYNASLGSVTFSAELWDAGYWGEKYGESFSLGAKCKEGPFSLEGPSAFKASVDAQPKEQGLGGTERGGVTGKATLRGFTGQVESNGTFNGKRFEVTFRSSRFRNRSWRCAEVHPEPTDKATTFYLDNWYQPRSKAQHRTKPR